MLCPMLIDALEKRLKVLIQLSILCKFITLRKTVDNLLLKNLSQYKSLNFLLLIKFNKQRFIDYMNLISTVASIRIVSSRLIFSFSLSAPSSSIPAQPLSLFIPQNLLQRSLFWFQWNWKCGTCFIFSPPFSILPFIYLLFFLFM